MNPLIFSNPIEKVIMKNSKDTNKLDEKLGCRKRRIDNIKKGISELKIVKAILEKNKKAQPKD